MPGPERDRIRLEPEERDALLRRGRAVEVATINRDGTPHLVPLFYVVDDAGRINFWTYGKSQKVVNLRRDPRLTCLVEEGARTEEIQFVQIYGTADIVEDPTVVETLGRALHERYVGPPGDAALERIRRQALKRVAVTVEPERVVTWDHRKLHENRQNT